MTQYESPGMMCQVCVRVCSGAWKKGYKAGIVIEASLGKRNGGSPILRKYSLFSLIFLCIDVFSMYVNLFSKQCIFTFIFLQDNLYLQIWPTVYKN